MATYTGTSAEYCSCSCFFGGCFSLAGCPAIRHDTGHAPLPIRGNWPLAKPMLCNRLSANSLTNDAFPTPPTPSSLRAFEAVTGFPNALFQSTPKATALRRRPLVLLSAAHKNCFISRFLSVCCGQMALEHNLLAHHMRDTVDEETFEHICCHTMLSCRSYIHIC